MHIMALSAATFSQVIADNSLVVIDFWAEWCQPCKTFSKVLEKMAGDYPDVVFASVNIEQETELAKDFNIISVPAIMVLKDQVVVYADSGAMPASALAELIDQARQLKVS